MTTPILMFLAVIASADGELPDYKLTSGLGTAPRLVEPDVDLPLSLKAPLDGRWINSDGHEIRAGEFLPYPLDIDVRRRLRLLRIYPDRCQAVLDRMKVQQAIDLEGALATRDAEHIINRVDAQIAVEEDVSSWRWYHYTVIGGAVALALAAGYGARAVTEKNQ